MEDSSKKTAFFGWRMVTIAMFADFCVVGFAFPILPGYSTCPGRGNGTFQILGYPYHTRFHAYFCYHHASRWKIIGYLFD